VGSLPKSKGSRRRAQFPFSTNKNVQAFKEKKKSVDQANSETPEMTNKKKRGGMRGNKEGCRVCVLKPGGKTFPVKEKEITAVQRGKANARRGRVCHIGIAADPDVVCPGIEEKRRTFRKKKKEKRGMLTLTKKDQNGKRWKKAGIITRRWCFRKLEAGRS